MPNASVKVDMEHPYVRDAFYAKYLPVGCVLPEIEAVMAALKAAVTARDVEVIQFGCQSSVDYSGCLVANVRPATATNNWKPLEGYKFFKEKHPGYIYCSTNKQ